MYSDKWEHDPPLQVFMWSTYALYQVYTLIAENNMNRIYFLQKLSNIWWYLYLHIIYLMIGNLWLLVNKKFKSLTIVLYNLGKNSKIVKGFAYLTTCTLFYSFMLQVFILSIDEGN